jgi:integrase
VSADGTLTIPDTLSGFYRTQATALGINPKSHYHWLRHTHATYALNGRAPLQSVSARLGHADPSTTLSFYADAMPGQDVGVSDAFLEMAKQA